ncbi:DNA cytosine methyltransferase [Streptomyces hydrogenans]|uniref:DNA cytosine methyltransferase n=1 Tax=Streptomyces hydrogenans TaxID=1873719 RepID=UPI0033322E21
MVERDAAADMWTLVVATPSDSRISRYTWRAGKWAVKGRGYRDTVEWYRSAMDASAGLTVKAEAAPVAAPVADASAETLAEAGAGVAAARAVLDAIKGSRKGEAALAEARKHADAAREFQRSAEAAQTEAEAARTQEEAEEAAEQAEADAKSAAAAVKDCKHAFERAKRARTQCRTAAEAAHGARYETEADAAWEAVKGDVETVRETLGEAEEAQEAAEAAAEAAREAADYCCGGCWEWVCACREIMCATLARYGSGAARTVDPEAVRIGELILSGDEERRTAGQLMLMGEWTEAEDTLAKLGEAPAEAAERRAAVRAAEAETEAEREAARPAEREEAQRTAERVAAADEAETHAMRAGEAYAITRDLMMYTLSAWAPRPVESLPEVEAAQARALLRLLDRRSRTANSLDFASRWDYADGSRVTDPQRARDCASRARVLADGCEAHARSVAELFAWTEHERREAAAEEERRAAVRWAEEELAQAEERAQRQSGYPSAQARRIGEGNARRAVQDARCALAELNGRPFVARAEISRAGHDRSWYVVDASRGRRIIASGFGCMAEAERDAARRNDERATEAAEAAAVARTAARRAEEAEERAKGARGRAERLGAAASAHYGRFAGGQPILMGHSSARGALRDRARGDAATRRAVDAAAGADRAEVAARKARQVAELAATVAGRSRPWERADFQRGDVVEVRKIYTDTYVVVRANAKTLTLRNAHTIDDVKARYDQILSRTRAGETLKDPGLSQELDEGTSTSDTPHGGKGGVSQGFDADASSEVAPARPDMISDPGTADTWEGEGGAVPGVATPDAPPAVSPAATTHEDEEDQEDEDAAAHAAAAGHPSFIECRTVAELLGAYAAQRPGDEEAEGWAMTAAERVDLCAWAVMDGADDAAAEFAREAKGERAAFTLGQLDDAGPMTAERLAALPAETLELLRWYAGPWPLRWLFPPEDGRPRVINLFHGPGGWSVGIRDVLRADVDMVGVDLDPGAVATAEAAGFEMIRASVTDLDPESPALQWVTGIILSPPCQAFSPAGLRMGRYASAIDLIVSVVRSTGHAAGFLALVDAEGRDAGFARRSGESWEEVREPLAGLEDPRAGLMAEVTIWPLAMLARGGSVEWVAVEQSSALPAEIEAALMAEFVQAGWGTVEAETLDAVDYGAASHRRRRFLTAHRSRSPFVAVRPAAPLPRVTFAECAGWERGRMVNTRGQRGLDPRTGRPKGGNAFSADKPSPCITATAYGWKDEESGERLDQATIGRLVGFPSAYPWQHVGRGAGIRNRAQQAADAVCPMVAAAVIGRALDVEEWEARARVYADALYRPGARRGVPLAPPRPRLTAEGVGPMVAEVSAPAAGGTVRVDAPAGRTVAVAAVGELAPAGAGAAVPGYLSRHAQGRGCRGVLAGHSTRQDATRQGARQGTRQAPGRGEGPLSGYGGRGPPPPPRPAGGSGGAGFLELDECTPTATERVRVHPWVHRKA